MSICIYCYFWVIANLQALETAICIFTAIYQLLLILVSQLLAAVEAPDAAHFRTLAAFLLKAHDSVNPPPIIIFGLGTLLLNSMFIQSRLILLWISLRGGFTVILLHPSTAFPVPFDVIHSECPPLTTLQVQGQPGVG